MTLEIKCNETDFAAVDIKAFYLSIACTSRGSSLLLFFSLLEARRALIFGSDITKNF